MENGDQIAEVTLDSEEEPEVVGQRNDENINEGRGDYESAASEEDEHHVEDGIDEENVVNDEDDEQKVVNETDNQQQAFKDVDNEERVIEDEIFEKKAVTDDGDQQRAVQDYSKQQRVKEAYEKTTVVNNSSVSSRTLAATPSFDHQRPCKTITVGEVQVPPGTGPDAPLAVIQSASKLDLVKAWSVNKIVCTRQILSEKLGRASITVDAELQLQIDATREAQRRLEEMTAQARALTQSVVSMVQGQQALFNTFRELGQKMPELTAEFDCNAETQKMVYKKGEKLIGDLNFFTFNVGTLCGKTIEDTLLTIRNYEAARLEYDAHRVGLGVDLKNPPRVESAEFSVHKEKYQRLRDDVSMKIKLLNENKLKVMRKQLFLLNCAVVTYFTENHSVMLAARQKSEDIRTSAQSSTSSLFDDEI